MRSASTASPAPDSSPSTGTALIHLDFVLTGVVMTLLGPMLPVLSARWSLNDTQSGYLFTTQFASSTLATILSGVLVRRWGYRLTLVFGLLLMALGLGLLANGTWIVGLASVCTFGVGTGLTTPAANLLIAETNPGRRAAALNLLNSSWGIGAMGCPFIVAAAQRAQRTSLFLYGMTAALALLAVCLGCVRFQVDAKDAPAEKAYVSATSVWKNPLVPIIAVLLFIYVGTENSVGGWVATYAQRMAPESHMAWAMTPSFFWGALLLGRVLAPLALRYSRERSVATAGLAIAVLGVVVLLAANTMTLVALGAGLAGLGLASIFPITVSLFSHWFGGAASCVVGAVFAFGNLGGATLPWLVGEVSTHFGSLKVGFMVPLLGGALMLAFYLADGKAQRNSLRPE